MVLVLLHHKPDIVSQRNTSSTVNNTFSSEAQFKWEAKICLEFFDINSILYKA